MRRLIAGIRDDRGVTLVEFALVIPVVLVLLIACIDFARVLNASVTIQNASREGARSGNTNVILSSAANGNNRRVNRATPAYVSADRANTSGPACSFRTYFVTIFTRLGPVASIGSLE